MAERDALDVVAGYICVNDVSARDLQFGDGQWTRGKSPDTFCPVGPRLVAARGDRRPAGAGHPLRAQRRDDAGLLDRPDDLLGGGDHRLRHQVITLEPGDLIATGTPAGVGVFRDPKVLLQDGDEVSVEIEGLGTLTNPVEKER